MSWSTNVRHVFGLIQSTATANLNRSRGGFSWWITPIQKRWWRLWRTFLVVAVAQPRVSAETTGNATSMNRFICGKSCVLFLVSLSKITNFSDRENSKLLDRAWNPCEWMNTRLISIFYLFVHLLSFFSFRMSVICNSLPLWVPGRGNNL